MAISDLFKSLISHVMQCLCCGLSKMGFQENMSPEMNDLNIDNEMNRFSGLKPIERIAGTLWALSREFG
jgi:hypothetical protein